MHKPDPPEVEDEHLHLRFLHACEGKPRTLGVHVQLEQEALNNKMVDHHLEVLALNDHVVSCYA
jgi:hypothetical protein